MEIRRGLLDDPRWLAAAIGGIVSAIAALWAMRGLPLGFAAFWLTSLPIFAAGLGFGSGSAFGALCVGTVMVLVLASEWQHDVQQMLVLAFPIRSAKSNT